MKHTFTAKQKAAVVLSAVFLLILVLFLVLFFPHGKRVDTFGQDFSVTLEDGTVLKGEPAGLVKNEDGSFYVADSALHVIWHVTETESRIAAGALGPADAAGRVQGAYADGAAAEARFDTPTFLLAYKSGLLISDTKNCVLRYFDPASGSVVTFAGTGEPGNRDGLLNEATFASPAGLCLDDAGNLFIADTLNHSVRKLDAAGYVSTFLGTAQGYVDGSFEVARLSYPTDVAFSDGTFYIADRGNFAVRAVENGELVTLCGADGGRTLASPTCVTADGDTLWVTDSGRGSLCRVEKHGVQTHLRAGEDGLMPALPVDVWAEGDTLYFTDADLGRLEVVRR